MATHSRIPRTEKPAGLQSTESPRVGHLKRLSTHTPSHYNKVSLTGTKYSSCTTAMTLLI